MRLGASPEVPALPEGHGRMPLGFGIGQSAARGPSELQPLDAAMTSPGSGGAGALSTASFSGGASVLSDAIVSTLGVARPAFSAMSPRSSTASSISLLADGRSLTSATSVSSTGTGSTLSTASPSVSNSSLATNFTAVSSEPTIASMTLTRDSAWTREGGVANVSVEVYNGTGQSTKDSQYWVTFFVEGNEAGLSIPEPTHAVPALMPGQTAQVPALTTEVIVAADTDVDLYALRAALVTSPKSTTLEPAPLYVQEGSELKIHWTRGPDALERGSGPIGSMNPPGQPPPGGPPVLESLTLVGSSIWKESGGFSNAQAGVWNNTGLYLQNCQYTVSFSVVNNPPGITVQVPTHCVPAMAPDAHALVPQPPTPIQVLNGTPAGAYTIKATLGTSEMTKDLYVVEVTDWTLEWQPPGGNWQAPDTTYAGPPSAPLLWSHDTMRWKATYAPAPPANAAPVQQINWKARPWSDPNAAWTSFTSINSDDWAQGKPAVGDWAITPEITFGGGAVAKMANPKRFVEARIESVDWAVYSGDRAGELQLHPEGWRFFPDASTPGGVSNYNVSLNVTVAPGLPGIQVRLGQFDVDDPSDHNGPIDDDTDNNHFNEADNFSAPSFLWDDGPTTNSQGLATTGFNPGPQPGDNSRVAAAGRLSELASLKGYEVYVGNPNPPPTANTGLFDDKNGNNQRDGNPLEAVLDDTNRFSGGAYVSRLLTVWRRLHVEVDRLAGLSESNGIQGTYTTGPTTPTTTTLLTDQTLNDSVNRFEGGTLVDSTNTAFVVVSNTAGANFQVVVQNLADGTRPANSGGFTLSDDDQAAWRKPMLDLFNLFQSAYIVASDMGPGTRDNILGQVNVEDGEIGTQLGLGKDFTSWPAYWIAYVQGSFQGGQNADFDPDSLPGPGEDPVDLGKTLGGGVGTLGTLIFFEVIRDVGASNPNVNPVILEQQVVVHEIAHQFNGVAGFHDTVGVLKATLLGNPADSFFGEESIKRLRQSTTVNQ
ncbi:MAG: hypothetical protein HY000_05445 [Planctomycetes bacterium]|nr:hypothetical protein [Planctomycetota bacterium]